MFSTFMYFKFGYFNVFNISFQYIKIHHNYKSQQRNVNILNIGIFYTTPAVYKSD